MLRVLFSVFDLELNKFTVENVVNLSELPKEILSNQESFQRDIPKKNIFCDKRVYFVVDDVVSPSIIGLIMSTHPLSAKQITDFIEEAGDDIILGCATAGFVGNSEKSVSIWTYQWGATVDLS
ncbi:MAG: hypothetical protein WAV51_00315 [Microgenomates group bacterium]